MKSTQKMYWLFVIGTFILFMWGSWLRLYPLSTQPYWMDEGYTINAVMSYAAGNRDGLAAVLDSGQSYKCFIYCYPTALITNITGVGAVQYRVLSVIFGLVTVLAVFFTTRRLYSLPIATLASFFTLFSYFQIAWSTQARWYTMVSAFFWISLWACLSFIKTNSEKQILRIIYASISVIVTILAIYTHAFAIILPVIIVGTIVWHYRTEMKQRLSFLSIIFFIFLTSAIILVLFQTIITDFLAAITMSYTLPYYLSFILREYWSLIPLIVYALVTAKRSELWLCFIFIAYLIPLAFLTDIVHYRYLFHVTPILFILASVGAYRLAHDLPIWLRHRYIITITLVVILFFYSGAGVLLPKTQYWLESDDPEQLGDRPSYAYTPQPDWNAAYMFIAKNRSADDIIISTQPPFTKIFLGEPGYWIYYDYLGLDNHTEYRTVDNREYYVGAQIIDDLYALQNLTGNNHGYIIFDYMSRDGRINTDIIEFITTNFELVYTKTDTSYSKIWVYKF